MALTQSFNHLFNQRIQALVFISPIHPEVPEICAHESFGSVIDKVLAQVVHQVAGVTEEEPDCYAWIERRCLRISVAYSAIQLLLWCLT